MERRRPMTCLKSTPPSSSVPGPQVVADLLGDRTADIVAVVELGIDVVHDRAEVALHGVEVDGALAVAIDAVVDVRDGRLDRPVRDAGHRVVDDLLDDLGLERPA